jgi:MFS transporter, DHA1 family, inner membrane transport protein
MNRVLTIVALVCFASSLFVRSVDPVIPPIAADLFVATTTAALLSTAFSFPYAFIQPVLGAMADMMGKVRLMTACLLVLVLAGLVGALATSFPVLMASRIVAGIASGGLFPIALALVGDLVPVGKRQVAISRLLFAGLSGNLLGASGAGVIGDLVGWRGVFFATALVGAAVLIASLVGLRGVESERPARFDLSTVAPNYRAIFGNPLAKICFTTVFLEGIFLFGLFPYVASLLYAAGETRSSIAGLVIAGFGVGGVTYTLMVSWLLSRIGERRLMVGGGILMGLALIVVAMRLPWPFEFVDFMLMGFAFYMLHGCVQVFVTELAPEARGSSTALHSAFFFFGQALGPVVYGFGFAQIGVAASLSVGAGVLTLAGITCASLLRHPKPARRFT